ncbi:MAG: protein-L-isoaspartate(D-aspartate) O-methyltransferase [Planctomycetaceae bacterium]|nr:protein-L-isoaspartate(D-aspartate) O-methyltransferase [Planctomycetaceae bacterium]
MVPSLGLSQSESQLTEARLKMVYEEVSGAGIKDERVIDAIREVPRHLFVSPQQRHLAYLDMALPIGEGQTISPPFIVAYMTEALMPRPTDKVLEIGTGSGYQAAVLGQLVAEVYSIEIVAPLGRKAAQTLRRLDYDNIHTKIGDGYQGWPEHAPFDSIIVTCSPERPPPALVQQLREGGRMVVPLGERYQQSLVLLKKVNGQLEAEPLQPTFFVPMTGRAEETRVRKNDDGVPRLLNASFEDTDDEDQLLGWYYVRQAKIVSDQEAMHGERFLAFSNEEAGRGAQALQAVGLDGREIATINLSLWIQATTVRPGRSTKELPRVNVSFFDEKQAPCGAQSVGPWYGTITWVKKQAVIQVPPKAKLAVVAVGMFGAVGEFAVDSVELTIGQKR